MGSPPVPSEYSLVWSRRLRYQYDPGGKYPALTVWWHTSLALEGCPPWVLPSACSVKTPRGNDLTRTKAPWQDTNKQQSWGFSSEERSYRDRQPADTPPWQGTSKQQSWGFSSEERSYRDRQLRQYPALGAPQRLLGQNPEG